ncbi:MAG TPA: hypothetical protein VGL40_13065 [Bacillota bacterium]
MPWKRCYYCGGWSYSAATIYDHWGCPYCKRDLTGSPECERVLLPVPDAAQEPGSGSAGGRDVPARPVRPSRVVPLRPAGRASQPLANRQ